MNNQEMVQENLSVLYKTKMELKELEEKNKDWFKMINDICSSNEETVINDIYLLDEETVDCMEKIEMFNEAISTILETIEDVKDFFEEEWICNK